MNLICYFCGVIYLYLVISNSWKNVHKYHEFELLNSVKWSALDQLLCQLSFHITFTSWVVYLKCGSSSWFPLGGCIDPSLLSLIAVFKLAFTGSDMKQSLHAKIKSIFTCILIIMLLFNYWLTVFLMYYALVRTGLRCSSSFWLYTNPGQAELNLQGEWLRKTSSHLDNDSGAQLLFDLMLKGTMVVVLGRRLVLWTLKNKKKHLL